MKTALRSLLNRAPRLKRWLKRLRASLGVGAGVSSDYRALSDADAQSESSRLRASWKSDLLPARQRELVDRQLAAYRAGEAVDVFDVMVDALRQLPAPVSGMSVLEVGCSSGFYAEVFDIADLGLHYTGCDYSDAFVDLARRTYPALPFDVEDATALRYGNASFDTVISGCCLLHIPEYETAIAETARVARRFAVFHRTPMVIGQPNAYYRKQAYGVETVEIHFNEPQFLALLQRHGLQLLATHTLDESIVNGVGTANRTYVCQKLPS